jgi:hypothetical protein
VSRRSATLLLAAATLVAGAATYLASGERSPERPTAKELSQLRALALGAAASFGDPTPDAATVAFGPHGEVIGHTGSVRRPRRDVFVVRLAGDFVKQFRVGPSGGTPIHGRLLELIYDAETLEFGGAAISRVPELSPFGGARQLLP